LDKKDAIHVDRIDVSKIKICGHDMAVTRSERLGVNIFFHPDGKPCTLLNSLRLTGAAVNSEDVLLTKAKAEAERIIDKVDDPIVYSRLMSDKELVKRLAKELDEETDIKRLESAFTRIARGKNAVEVFRAMGQALGPDKNDIILNNVAAIFAKEYREGSVEGLQHLYPLVIEAQQVIAKKKNKTK